MVNRANVKNLQDSPNLVNTTLFKSAVSDCNKILIVFALNRVYHYYKYIFSVESELSDPKMQSIAFCQSCLWHKNSYEISVN